MNKLNELFEQGVELWRANKGVGTAMIPSRFDSRPFLLDILQRFYIRNPTLHTLIIVDDFSTRQNLIEYLTNQETKENNEEFADLIRRKYLMIYTKDFYASMTNKQGYVLFIAYKIESIDASIIMDIIHTKFKLVILDKPLQDNYQATRLYEHCPSLDCFQHYDVEAVRLTSPVEERLICTEINSSKEIELLAKYNEYITTSINIFGSFDIMQTAKIGNPALRMSAAQVCDAIAKENGWNEHLDMTIQFNIEIDALYNPGNLRERAVQTYDIIRKRRDLITDYNGKLEKILDIVKELDGKKILIISKRSEFANAITEYINTYSESDICRNYHNKMEGIPAVNAEGRPLYYKSGPHKGDRKMMQEKAQKTLNELLFNRGDISILSANQAPDTSLSINVDAIIITSPLCETIKSYIYRLSNVGLNKDKLLLYTLYCKDTLEEKALKERELLPNQVIINPINNFTINDANSDFIIVD